MAGAVPHATPFGEIIVRVCTARPVFTVHRDTTVIDQSGGGWQQSQNLLWDKGIGGARAFVDTMSVKP
jgi:hypothetical protein